MALVPGLSRSVFIRQLFKEFQYSSPPPFEHVFEIHGIRMGNLMVKFSDALLHLFLEVLLFIGGKF